MRDTEPLSWWAVVLVLFIGGLVVWYISRPERYTECRDRCARNGLKAWAYNPDKGTCSCGGVEP